MPKAYPAKDAAEAQHLVRLIEQEGYTPSLTLTATKALVSSAMPTKAWRKVINKLRKQRELQEVAGRYLEQEGKLL